LVPPSDEALQGPTATVSPVPPDEDPWAVANDPKLDPRAKLARLQQIELDVRLVENSLQEGMSGNTPMPALSEVLAAIEQVMDEIDELG
jgi:hypothetical protein